MRTIHSIEAAGPDQDVVLTIGSFDGVHRGHQHLLRALIQRARETQRLSAALTFHPHPRAALQADPQPTYLSTPDERAAVMADLGLDLLVLLPFSHELAQTSAHDFVAMLYDWLRMRELWVGADFALGRGREGDTARLASLAEKLGFALRVVRPLYAGCEPISSTRIRALLAEGNMAETSRLLGRHYAIAGSVVHGAQRGRTLGVRTANLRIAPNRTAPPDGVYAVWGLIGGQRWPAVANLGIRPSFDAGERLIEVHLLDYAGDLYGNTLTVEFVSYLRPEMRFADPQALVAQIQVDIRRARTELAQDAPISRP
jgi:riboflavin kinase/FMN adenylyltransferase